MFYLYVLYCNYCIYKPLQCAICHPSSVIGRGYIEVFTVCFTYMSSIVTRKEYMYLQASTMCYCLSYMSSIVTRKEYMYLQASTMCYCYCLSLYCHW